jgi:hypothetical protein
MGDAYMEALIVPSDVDGFREKRRRKRNSSGGKATQKNRATPPMSVEGKPPTKPPTTRNYFAPLGTADMDIPEREEADTQDQQQTQATAGRPPPIVLTASTNLMHLQKELKGLVKGNFEFRNTRNGTRVVTREMADYSAIRAYYDGRKLNYYTFHPKSEKPIKAVIRHLPRDRPAKDISNGLTELGFRVLSVRQMTANRRSPEGETQNLPVPGDATQTRQVTRNFQAIIPVPHCDQGGSLQSPKWINAVF